MYRLGDKYISRYGSDTYKLVFILPEIDNSMGLKMVEKGNLKNLEAPIYWRQELNCSPLYLFMHLDRVAVQRSLHV